MAVFHPDMFDSGVFDTGGGTGAMDAAGTFEMSGAAQLRLFHTFDAAGAFVLTGEATIEASVTLAVSGLMVLTGSAALRTGKVAAILRGCGGPLAADCDEWLLAPFQRDE